MCATRSIGRRLADKLVQVWRLDGSDAWVLIHIEVQSQEETDFARRMFSYYYRLLDRYDRPVMSVAVLGDEREGWRPDQFESALWGCAAHFRYPVIKLRDYRARWADLEASTNPFATVVMAHLTAQTTRHDPARRAEVKLSLTRRLYGLGYAREDVIQLFHFIDWLLQLPDVLTAQFWHAMETWEEAQRMPYITSVERIGIEKGRVEGRVEGQQELVMRLLGHKLGALPPAAQGQVSALSPALLLELSDALLDFAALGDLTAWLALRAPDAE